jgi:hypothetical protein
MAANEVYMDIPIVRGFSKTFGEISQLLNTVSKVLENLANILKATAFVGMVGGAVLAFYMDNMSKQLANMSQEAQQLSEDLTKSVDAYERGDAQGATRFH